MRDPRRCIEIGKTSLCETEIAVEAIDQNLERVLQRVEITLLFRIFRSAHLRFRFESERAEIGKQVPENLELIGRWKAIELEHDRGIQLSEVAMPYVTTDTSE